MMNENIYTVVNNKNMPYPVGVKTLDRYGIVTTGTIIFKIFINDKPAKLVNILLLNNILDH